MKNYPGSQIYRIACGANAADYRWTEVMMASAGRQMNGLSLHYYTIPTGDWGRKGSATKFGEAEWFFTLNNALEMETLLQRHSAIMDKADPEKRVGLMVDEWGIWHDVEPGTNPGFLYQQNTMRDALVAGLTLNLFNQRADRVRMANIAQLINVLQAVALTDKEKMLLTPTYHVFEMYAAHQDATLLPIELKAAEYTFAQGKIPGLSVSASKDKGGKIHVSLCNLNPNSAAELECELQGAKVGKLGGRVLTAASMQAVNTFESPDTIKPAPFTAFKTTDTGCSVTLPARSVVVLEIE